MIAFRERFSYWYVPCPIGSMYAIYGIIYHQNTPNVSIYTINGSYGCCAMVKHVKTWFFIFLVEWRTVNLWQHMATNWASKVFKFYSVFFWQHVSPFQVLVSSCIILYHWNSSLQKWTKSADSWGPSTVYQDPTPTVSRLPSAGAGLLSVAFACSSVET
jgi:hypothetical protein